MVRTSLLALVLALGGGAPYLGSFADVVHSIWAADQVDVGGQADPNGTTTNVGNHADPNGSGAAGDVGGMNDPNGLMFP